MAVELENSVATPEVSIPAKTYPIAWLRYFRSEAEANGPCQVEFALDASRVDEVTGLRENVPLASLVIPDLFADLTAAEYQAMLTLTEMCRRRAGL